MATSNETVAAPELVGHSELKQNAMGTSGVVFLVLAGITPLGAFTGMLPLGMGFGNGAAFPGILLMAAITLLCFAVGYVAMSHHITNAGAFYAYISRGIGRPFGVGASLVAIFSYLCVVISIAGVFGFFAQNTFSAQLGIDISWWVFSLFILAAVGALAVRGIDLSAKILMVVCIFEFAIVMIVAIAIIAKTGLSGYTLSSFSPAMMAKGAPGVAIVFAFNLFIGFEATAIYSEESRDPKRTIGRATYISLATISIFYVFITWTLVAGYGASDVQEIAAADPGNFAFTTAAVYVGQWASDVMQWGILVGLFAALLGLHNSTSRYLFALGRSHLLPGQLGRVHRRYGSPFVASLTVTGIEILVVSLSALAGLDPFIQLGAVTGAVTAFGIVLLQAFAAVSVIGFFWRRPDRSWARTVILPGLGATGLFIASYFIMRNFSMLTGSQVAWINSLPWITIGIGVVGVLYALWLRSARSDTYEAIVRTIEVGETTVPAEVYEQ